MQQSLRARGEITANGLRFAYLETREGTLVLLLHGFRSSCRGYLKSCAARATSP